MLSRICQIHKANPSLQCAQPAVCFAMIHKREIFADSHCVNFCPEHLHHEFKRSLAERNYYWAGDIIPITPWVIPRRNEQ